MTPTQQPGPEPVAVHIAHQSLPSVVAVAAAVAAADTPAASAPSVLDPKIVYVVKEEASTAVAPSSHADMPFAESVLPEPPVEPEPAPSALLELAVALGRAAAPAPFAASGIVAGLAFALLAPIEIAAVGERRWLAGPSHYVVLASKPISRVHAPQGQPPIQFADH